jgi:cytochrome c peroxidase
VGTTGPLDRPTDKFTTPTLVEVWRTAPYIHDGRYLTIEELIVHGKHGLQNNVFDSLSKQQIDDLVEYILSL